MSFFADITLFGSVCFINFYYSFTCKFSLIGQKFDEAGKITLILSRAILSHLFLSLEFSGLSHLFDFKIPDNQGISLSILNQFFRKFVLKIP
jgi:hypothetical protein